MYLTSFKINDFQSYRTAQELRLDRDITILAGRNNVGKTALLRGLRLPIESHQGIGSGFRADYEWEVTYQELELALPTVAEAFHAAGISQTSSRYTLLATLAMTLPSGRPSQWNGPSPYIGSTGMLLVQSGIADTALRLHVEDSSQRVGHGPTITVGRMWWDGPDVRPEDEYWTGLAQAWARFIANCVFNSYYVQPRRIGAQSTPYNVVGQLDADGSNLTNVVATLYVNDRTTIFQQLEAFMRSAFPEISRIEVRFDGSPAIATIRLVYGSPSGDLIVPLLYCGTGIEQMLMLATALLTANTPRLFLIDEPHAFLHPAAERSLLRLIRSHPEHQYLVATHSSVFLNAVPLSQTRLITIDGGGSHVNDVHDAAHILTELGVTAADLWSADALFWIEGPSDVRAVEALIANTPDVQDVTIRVLAMPDWIRSVSSSEKKAQSVVRFCEAVRGAITPFKVPLLFVFDADEKTHDFKERVAAATGNRAYFLPVRELENLLLVPAAIQKVLAEPCFAVGMPIPLVNVVTSSIKELLAQTDDRKLYKSDPGAPDTAKVVGSEVLGRLWSQWARTSYDKVEYGDKLVKAVNEYEPDKLEPLRALLRDLAASARTNHLEF